jgi:hypothetical protein
MVAVPDYLMQYNCVTYYTAYELPMSIGGRERGPKLSKFSSMQ